MVHIGVVGCGAMGLSVVRQLLACDNRLRVTAIYDPDPRSVEAAKAELGTSCTVCADYREVVNKPDVQWVMIASWNCFHAEQVVASFEAGKHVFCQKPLALSVEECVTMMRA